MLLTIFLLGLVYASLVGVLVASGAGAVTIAIIAAGLFAVQLFTSDKIALASMGARQVSPQEAPQLHAIIDRLCVQANIPKPRVAIAQTPMPNAFAVGRSPKTATVCATTRDPPAARARRARGGARTRDHPRHESRRRGDDDRELLRLDRRVHHPVRVLVRRRLRRREPQQPEQQRLLRRDPGLRGGLRDLVPAAPGALALPRVRRGPRLGDHHRPAERPDQRTAEDRRRHGPDPAARPARRIERARRLLHLPAEGQAGRDQPVLDPPAAGGDGSSDCSGSRLSSRAPPDDEWASSTC